MPAQWYLPALREGHDDAKDGSVEEDCVAEG